MTASNGRRVLLEGDLFLGICCNKCWGLSVSSSLSRVEVQVQHHGSSCLAETLACHLNGWKTSTDGVGPS